jgi:hypothetical protein
MKLCTEDDAVDLAPCVREHAVSTGYGNRKRKHRTRRISLTAAHSPVFTLTAL